MTYKSVKTAHTLHYQNIFRVRLLLCEKISITMTSSPSSATKKSDSEKFAYTSSSTSNNSDFQLKELIKAIFLANNIFVVNNQKFNISYNGSYHSVQIAAQVFIIFILIVIPIVSLHTCLIHCINVRLCFPI